MPADTKHKALSSIPSIAGKKQQKKFSFLKIAVTGWDLTVLV
jgi:hypothetical protein